MNEIGVKIRSLQRKRAHLLARAGQEAKQLDREFAGRLKAGKTPLLKLAAIFMGKHKHIVCPLKQEAEDCRRAIDLLKE